MLPLRCLLFSSNAEVVQPIWKVLADLGIEGEHCQTAVHAVEKVTTQSFQIVITDWEDQPEAAFLLKTVRELKASQRPLTLAIVSDDARRPQALQAGANSILLKPIRAEQVRDTMSTACELLRSKLQPPATVPAREASATMALGAAAAAGPASLPASVTRAPEKIRAGEFLQSASAAPGAQFDTEPETENSQAPTVAVSAVTELEPTAAATVTTQPRPQQPLTGWAMLQARLTTDVLRPAASAGQNSELLSYGDTRSQPSPSAETPGSHTKISGSKDLREDSESEAHLFAYMPGRSTEDLQPAPTSRPRHSKAFVLAALAVIFGGLVALPRTRQGVFAIYRNSVGAGNRLLNPPPAALPQAVALHDSFGQSGDEYNLPVPTNIPDATTDPSQIRVLSVIDPTAKPQKTLDPNPGSEQAPSLENPPQDQDQTAPNQTEQRQPDVRDPASTSIGDVPKNPADTRLDLVPAQSNPVTTLAPRPAAPQSPHPSLTPRSAPQHATSAVAVAAIPSSLRSHIASSVPQSSGSKPVEAAMSSIEPVNLPEPVAREFLIQPVDAVYPASARASGQRGTVVLQVLVGRDGSIQDAKFMQGSLIFARAAIDAVRQYRFKPYSLNGRPVSVQSVITLNFKPPA
jgi:periplasmic protein TonB